MRLWKMYALLASVWRHSLSHPGQEIDHSLTLRFQLAQFKSIPPLIFLLFQIGQLFKSHYFLIKSKVEIWNTWFLLAHFRNAVPYCTRIISPFLLVFSLYLSVTLSLSLTLCLCKLLYKSFTLAIPHKLNC